METLIVIIEAVIVLFKNFQKHFLTGLLILLPITVSLKLIFWGFRQTDAILGNFINKYFAGYFYRLLQLFGIEWQGRVPGLGLIVLVILITLTGLFARHYLGRKLIAYGEKLLNKIPILNTIYNLLKQITEGVAFTRSDQGAFRKVVMVEYPRPGIQSIGFLTGEAIKESSDKIGKKLMGVFIPTAPNPTTGFLIYLPEEDIVMLDLSVEDGLKLILSVGVIKPESN
ncbi:MAG TPA: DUF502 domain-containing protein [Bacillota bacterium]|jgi:uncharacterized membrane protein|nr:DUF502 domain-containing protein [Bacillota bacterium]HOL09318.1 DUF502 domain-containing protein [Bacillota bacterium]HPO97651.1 DUF502 domain-containing protein [Bacillota bacterium]